MKAYLVPDRTYIVGTNGKVVDILVKDDRTVSRQHAKLRVVVGDSSSGSESPGKSYVQVTDTSSHGRTYLSKDMRDILKAQKVKDLADASGLEEASANAYHGYFMMLGQISPFRLTRMAMGVCLSGKVPRAVEKAVSTLGIPVVEAEGLGGGGSGEATMRTVVADSAVEVRDEVLLSMVAGIPVVTGGWVLAWLDEGREATSAPREEEYGVSVVGRNGGKLDVRAYEKRRIAEDLSAELGSFRLGCVAGDVTGALVAAARGLGLVVDVIPGREYIDEWVMGCAETPLVVLRRQADVRLLPQPPCEYCLVGDLRFALLDGETAGLVRRIDGNGSKKTGPTQGKTKDTVMSAVGDSEGWHDALNSEPSADITDVEEVRDDQPIYTTEARVIVREKGLKPKTFKKKHRIPDAAKREIVEVVGARPNLRQDDQEWVEEEQERQAMMEAFDKQGLVIGAKKRAPKKK